MKILIVSATLTEVEPLAGSTIKPYVPFPIHIIPGMSVDLLVTGVGATATTFHLARYGSGYDLILNIGIAGSYKKELNIGSIVFVSHDNFGDLGIDDNGSFIPLHKVNFDIKPDNPLADDLMTNPWLNFFNEINIIQAKGITLGTTSGSTERIESIKKIWNPDIETMESAAVFYSCLKLHIPFACIRAISNMVEPRDKSHWESHKAINNICNYTKEILPFLSRLNLHETKT